MGQSNRIVITGMGMVGPFGVGIERFRQTLIEGENCLTPASKYDFLRTGGEVKGFSLKSFAKDARLAKLPLLSQYALASAVMAVADASIEFRRVGAEKSVVVFGTCNGPSLATEKICSSLVKAGGKSVDPLAFQESVFNAPASLVSIYYGIKGPSITMPMGPASGSYALSAAINQLNLYNMDCAIVVASDELSKTTYDAFAHLRVTSPNDGREEGMRPFDRKRNGCVLSEGAVALILETESAARKRGAAIYGEIAGDGMASDGYGVADNNPNGTGICKSLNNALNRAHVSVSDIDYIAALSLSSQKLDTAETKGIKAAMGKKAYGIPVSSIKSFLGETLGAGGLFNIAAGIFAIRDGIVPPTINYEHPDEECDLDYVPNHARQMKINTVVSNSFSWGGIYHSTVLRKYQ